MPADLSTPDPRPALSGARPAPPAAASEGRSHWRTFVRGSAGLGVALAARAAGGLLLNKLIASYGGPGSLTQLAQFQNLMGLFQALPTDGVQVGATTYLAPLRPGQPRHRLWLAAALWLTAGLVLAAGLLLALVGGPAWPLVRTLIFTAAMLLLAGQALLGAALLAAGRLRVYMGIVLLISALSVAVVAGLLALQQPLDRVLLGYAAGQALAFGPVLGVARRAGLLPQWRLRRPSQVALRGLLNFLLMAGGTLFFGRAVEYAVRAYLMAHFAPAATDLWQAVAKLSDSYTLLLGAVLSAVFYPRLAALAPFPAEQRRYVSVVAGLLAGGLAGGLGLVFWVRHWLLGLLFAPHLAAAAPLLGPQLLGDWAKLVSWVFLYALLVRARPGPYLAVQGVGAAVYVGLLAGLVPAQGLPGVVIAYAADNSILLMGCVVWFYGPHFRAKIRLQPPTILSSYLEK